MRRRGFLAGILAASGATLAYRALRFDLPSNPATLVIATPWPEPITTEWEARFRSITQVGSPINQVPVEWIRISSFAELLLLTQRLDRIDLILGGSAEIYLQLDQEGRLAPWPGSSSDPKPRAGTDPRPEPAWRVCSDFTIGFHIQDQDFANPDGRLLWQRGSTSDWESWLSQLTESLQLTDPRTSMVSGDYFTSGLGWDQQGWQDRYAVILQIFARAEPIPFHRVSIGSDSRGAGRATLRIHQRESVTDPRLDAINSDPTSESWVGPLTWEQGVAVSRIHPETSAAVTAWISAMEAELILRRPGDSPSSSVVSPEASALMRDFLGAILVDAQPELARAWRGWNQAGRPRDWQRLLMTPPPWPPASILKLRRDQQRNQATSGANLVETLIGLLVTEPSQREWLRRSWSQARRPLGPDQLRSLADCDMGRMMTVTSFRTWLLMEWTAWARQRFERIARDVGRRPAPEIPQVDEAGS